MAPVGDTDHTVDYYELLQIPVQATESEIRRAYRKTSLLYHPDKVKPTAETSAKFQQLQIALTILTDPVEKEKYDQSREAKQRRQIENEALEGRRRKMKEDLEKRETGTAGVSVHLNGVKRKWTDQELEIKRIAEQNAKRREAMVQARVQKAKVDVEIEGPSDAIQRSVKIRWLKEGDGLDIDQQTLTEMCTIFGLVENVLLLKDKKRRMEGKDRKSVIGTAVVVFSSLQAAKKSVEGGAWVGIESVTWAADKQGDLG